MGLEKVVYVFWVFLEFWILLIYEMEAIVDEPWAKVPRWWEFMPWFHLIGLLYQSLCRAALGNDPEAASGQTPGAKWMGQFYWCRKILQLNMLLSLSLSFWFKIWDIFIKAQLSSIVPFQYCKLFGRLEVSRIMQLTVYPFTYLHICGSQIHHPASCGCPIL